MNMTNTSQAPTGVLPADWADLEETVLSWAKAGFTSPRWLRVGIGEYAEGSEEYAAVGKKDYDVLVDAVVSTVRAQQATWTGFSDSDRLDRAFAALENEGIVARMNFACCNTCGQEEISAEVAEGEAARGYVFFHTQDADNLGSKSAELYLSYGVFRPDDLPRDSTKEEAERRWATDITELATRVVEVINTMGLSASWNQNPDTRIRVDITDWRRRMPQDES